MMKNLLFLVLALGLALGFESCSKKFDEPPIEQLPNITANTTIAELKSRHIIGQNDQLIADSVIIEGIVIADDRSGNYFERIVIQDNTGGLEIRLNTADLYNEFPIGRKIYVKCAGLYLGDYNGSHQLNGSPDNAIEPALIPQHIIGGARNQPVVPKVVTIDNITAADVNTLVMFDSVEFAGNSMDVPYADAINRLSVNLTVKDCGGSTIIMRTSGYANFANLHTPTGRGPITAVLGIFSSDLIFDADEYQLAIRSAIDVQTYGVRCNGGGGGGGGSTIMDVRSQFTGATTNVSGISTIRGIVISDLNTFNITGKNLVLQDNTGGIVVRFTANNTFNLGDEIEVNVDGVELSEFNGLLQLNNVDNAGATLISSGNTVTPRVTTVADLNANFEDWESTLVQIANATLTGQATYSGTVTLGDGTGNMDLYTRNTATFAANTVPTGTVTVTAIVSQFNTAQLTLRDATDVTGGGGGGNNPVLTTIASIRGQFVAPGPMNVTGNWKIRGVVTSDKNNLNINNRNLYIQDASGAILVRFTAAHTFNLGDEIEVNVTSVQLFDYNGLLELNNTPNANATLIGTGTLPTPVTTDIDNLLSNFEAYESQLVRITGVTMSGNTVYSGNVTLDDQTATVTLYTLTGATFSQTPIPLNTVTVVGIVSPFNGPQVIIRNLSDVQ